jgi:hypothetical protein
MKLVYIPLDERPCNYYFAQRIAKGSPIEVKSPPRELLGYKKTPANVEALEKFLLESAAEADSFVLSLDMLLYGGILPSRLHHASEEELTERLSVIQKIKAVNPAAKIYAFALIMRCPRYSSSDEEPDYYEHCGEQIFRTGQVKHKRELGMIDDAEAERLLAEYAAFTGEHLADFEHRRKVNRNMLIKIIKLLGKGIDFLVIPQDDSAEFGYTSMDREAIKKVISEGLSEVAMYPGADEVGMTLLARAACDYKGVSPKIECIFAHENNPNLVPLYEDRPLGQTLPHQIQSAGGIQVAEGESSDIRLFLNYPASEHREVFEEPSQGYAARNLPLFCQKIASSVAEGRVSALADGAYCNGGDKEILQLLQSQMPLSGLSAYAGWNTSSNTLGTVICQAIFVFLFGDNHHHKRFLAERICEDVGYCGYVRSLVTNRYLPSMGYNYFDAGEAEGEVASLVRRELEAFIGQYFPTVWEEYKISVCRMPWRRMFEVDLSLEEIAK